MTTEEKANNTHDNFAKAALTATIIAARFGIERKVPWLTTVISQVMAGETYEMDLEEFIDPHPPLTQWEIVKSAVLYHYNVDLDAQFKAANFPEEDGNSEGFAELVKQHREGLVNWFNWLDHNRSVSWIKAACKQYGPECHRESQFYYEAVSRFVENDQ